MSVIVGWQFLTMTVERVSLVTLGRHVEEPQAGAADLCG
jgi:hypothetical protein